MKLTSILVFICFAMNSLIAQNYEPQIVILSPNERIFEKYFAKEIALKNEEIEKMRQGNPDKKLFGDDVSGQPENLQRMARSLQDYFKTMDFFGQVSFNASGYLSYRFFERFPQQMILLSQKRSNGSLAELKEIAIIEKSRYVLNISKISLYRKRGVSYASLTVQLYDDHSGDYVITKAYEGDWLNPGLEFSCENQSIQCTINNALSFLLSDVIKEIASSSPTLKRERALEKERYQLLISNHLNRPFDKTLLNTVIRESGLKFSVDHVYQILYNDVNTKFVAFSVELGTAKDLKDLNEEDKDSNVKIISSKDMMDKDFLNVPQTYGFIIKGVKHNGKWYCEKGAVTYFEATSLSEAKENYFNNLQQWNFFAENSALVTPDFWETSLFAKMKDLKLDADWNKYGDSIWKNEEMNNRPYIGLYEVVANAMREERRKEDTEFEKQIKELLGKVYNNLTKNPEEYATISKHSLIYPSDQSVALNPVLVSNKKGIAFIHYFIVIPGTNAIYEWNYIQQKPTDKERFGDVVTDDLNVLTNFSFSYDHIDDKDFWEKYVLVKEGTGYKYLTRIKL